MGSISLEIQDLVIIFADFEFQFSNVKLVDHCHPDMEIPSYFEEIAESETFISLSKYFEVEGVKIFHIGQFTSSRLESSIHSDESHAPSSAEDSPVSSDSDYSQNCRYAEYVLRTRHQLLFIPKVFSRALFKSPQTDAESNNLSDIISFKSLVESITILTSPSKIEQLLEVFTIQPEKNSEEPSQSANNTEKKNIFTFSMLIEKTTLILSENCKITKKDFRLLREIPPESLKEIPHLRLELDSILFSVTSDECFKVEGQIGALNFMEFEPISNSYISMAKKSLISTEKSILKFEIKTSANDIEILDYNIYLAPLHVDLFYSKISKWSKYFKFNRPNSNFEQKSAWKSIFINSSLLRIKLSLMNNAENIIPFFQYENLQVSYNQREKVELNCNFSNLLFGFIDSSTETLKKVISFESINVSKTADINKCFAAISEELIQNLHKNHRVKNVVSDEWLEINKTQKKETPLGKIPEIQCVRSFIFLF